MIAIVLAAGAGRRLGIVNKAALLAADGRTFLATIAATARVAKANALLVVVGPPHQEATQAIASSLGAAVVRNPDPERGMASSVALGFEHALRSHGAQETALLWPVDHPLVQAATVAELAARGGYERIVVPQHGDRGGHPPVIGRRFWTAFAACAGAPDGARSVLHRERRHVVRIAVEDRGVIADVDEPVDLPQP